MFTLHVSSLDFRTFSQLSQYPSHTKTDFTVIPIAYYIKSDNQEKLEAIYKYI